MTSPAPVDARGLSKTYRLGFWFTRRVEALRQLDLTVTPGEVYGLLGPNGAGKSTTIKVLMNLVQPTLGTATIFGLSPLDKRCRALVGFVPENPAPYDYLSGREFVTLVAQLCGLNAHEADQRTKEVLAQVGLERAADLQLRRYSKGMVQRVTVAQALVARPKLLVLDEPTSGLDPVGRRQMRDLILAERQRGTTVLFCTHIISDVEAVCDRVAVLVGGKKVREGSVRDLLTSDVPAMEATFEQLSAEAVKASGIPVEKVESIGNRTTVRANDAAMQALLRKVTEQGGRIIHVNPVKFSLEELFLQAIQEAGQASVGAEIS
jgi:ABC-2 type transport system ATP-binding protein